MQGCLDLDLDGPRMHAKNNKMLIECVPNISEGRNSELIYDIAAAALVDKKVQLLHTDSDVDANRTVFTFAGEPEALLTAMFNLIQRTFELIDMRTQSGEHPRLGAVDVVPFIPLVDASMIDCIELARELGRRVGEKLQVPVYLYAEAALSEDRKNLANIRKGEYEALVDKFAGTQWSPDFGPSTFIAKTGAVSIGARDFLIAFNIDLATNDARVAEEIAKKIRNEREKGNLCSVKAIGWLMPSREHAQVSFNLTNFNEDGLFEVYLTAKRFTEELDTEITGSEIVGLVPSRALVDAGEKAGGLGSEDELISAAITYLKLRNFEAKKRVIEWCLVS